MRINAYRTLRISLAAAAVLLLFAECGFAVQTYTVHKGDTVYNISKKFGVSAAALQKANKLSAPSLKLGQTLTIPSKSSAPSSNVTYGRSTLTSLDVLANGAVVGTVSKDARFIVLERNGDVFKVRLDTGKTGVVPAEAVTLEDTYKPQPISDTWGLRKSIVEKAYACRGARYVRGGTGGYGFDCSGLVKYLYASMGIKLPHSSAAMYQYGTSVHKAELQPGDILFFSNTYRAGISHVGVYVGEGKFIHASTQRAGVRVDSMDADYYRRHYAGAKRVK